MCAWWFAYGCVENILENILSGTVYKTGNENEEK